MGWFILDVVSRGLELKEIYYKHKFYKDFYKDFEEKDDKAFRALRILLCPMLGLKMSYLRNMTQIIKFFQL